MMSKVFRHKAWCIVAFVLIGAAYAASMGVWTCRKKTSGGVMSMRDIKKTVSKTFEGMSAEQRKDYLKKCQEEMKRGGR